jgi:hypothetical protein
MTAVLYRELMHETRIYSNTATHMILHLDCQYWHLGGKENKLCSEDPDQGFHSEEFYQSQAVKG